MPSDQEILKHCLSINYDIQLTNTTNTLSGVANLSLLQKSGNLPKLVVVVTLPIENWKSKIFETFMNVSFFSNLKSYCQILLIRLLSSENLKLPLICEYKKRVLWLN